jgi:Lrp/AsnC family leucine-responsive transcriptional regulator
MSYTELAKAVDMKPPSIIERINKMKNDGIIKGYSAQVDYSKLGYDITALIGVIIDSPEHISAFEASVEEIDIGIVNCYHVTGHYTLMLRVVTENTNSLALIIKKLRIIPGVTKTNTILILTTMMERMRII